METIKQEWFERSDYFGYFKQVYKRFGLRALDKQFRKTIRRPFSRDLINRFSPPPGIGIEIGVGNQTIAPMSRTVLTDGFHEHVAIDSWAKLFIKGDAIPFSENTFSFVLTEHVLEHVPNPIKLLKEWQRVLKKDGHLFLFLPHRDRTFDRYRQRTTLDHLIDDHKQNRDDGDRTHLQDWMDNVISKGIALHYSAYSPDDMIKKGLMHHHVWVTEDIVKLLVFNT
jgi:SAM-dependent methyltransferase